MVKTRCIGLTGGIATGKSTVARILANRGYPVIDADELSRHAVLPGSSSLHRIVDVFGPGILANDGNLSRKKLADIVFSDASLKGQLEAILHPEIQRLFLERLANYQTAPVIFYEASLLVETKRQRDFLQLWATVCSRQTQIQRLIKFRRMDESTAEKLINSQMPAEEKARVADVVIRTDCALPEVELQVADALRRIPMVTP